VNGAARVDQPGWVLRPDPERPAVTAAPDPATFVVDLQGKAAYLGGRSVPLTAREYLLLELLYTSRGRLFGRDDILERLWGLDFPGDARIVDTYVKRLRAKLGAGAVETVRGLGYRCPLPDAAGVAQPNLERLPPEARLLTRLAQRILQVTDPGHIISDVYELLREQYAIGGVALWAFHDQAPEQAPQLNSSPLVWAGAVAVSRRPPQSLNDQPGLAVVPLGTGAVGEGHWALLTFAEANLQDGSSLQGEGRQTVKTVNPDDTSAQRDWPGGGPSGWAIEVRSALDAVAGLVNPALRLNQEIVRRQQAEQEVRSLNTELEVRVQTRTQALARANADLSALYGLAQRLAGAESLHEVLSQGLSMLAQLAGASVCSLWRLRSAELSCLAAYSPAHRDLRSAVQQEAALLAVALRQSVACTSDHSILTRSAELPGGRQLLLVPVASGLAEVHALHLELLGEVPEDLSLLDAAARAFGLAFERQMQTLMLEQAALNDELTGLPNRRALLADLTSELSYSQRHRTSLTLSLFEIPDIRAVNLRLGFAGGNDLIRTLAAELVSTLRTEDRVYRLGGAVLASLVRSVDVQEGRALTARLSALAARFGVGGLSAKQPGDGLLRVSHAHSPGEAGELSQLLHLALQRLDQDPEHPVRPQQPSPSTSTNLGPTSASSDSDSADSVSSDSASSDSAHPNTASPNNAFGPDQPAGEGRAPGGDAP
jgi:diguanylate cyclase (GGDEF)-like protein